VGWFSLERAQRILTFSGEREVLRMARARLRA
jgi:hypothetical protein